jgi:DNA-binding transcriptional regulator YbjK
LETLKELQRELANEKKLIHDETNDRNQVIQQLKDTIQEINSLTVSEQKYIKKEVKAHENSVKMNCSYRESQLVKEKELLLKKLEQENLVHEKIMSFLASERDDLEKSIQEWMVHYEEDTEAKAQELEMLKAKRTSDLDKFEELVAQYESLEKVVDEDRRQRAQEQEEQILAKKKEKAAVMIQKWYRKQKRIRDQLVQTLYVDGSQSTSQERKERKKEEGKEVINISMLTLF